MANFSNVPVIDVHIDNIKEMWPTIIIALKTSIFVAMDTELSGLGDRKKLNAKSVEDRYSAMSHIARSRAILSLGLSCFRLTQNGSISSQEPRLLETASSEQGHVEVQEANKSDRNLKFTVQTFNIVLLCIEDYVVEPGSLKFLVDHGFDFNKQYAKGIPYYRGNDQDLENPADSDIFIRNLYSTLISLKVPVVFHNAMVDLVFLYHSFHAALPPGLAVFLADSAEMFSGGIYDTKYLAEYQSRMPASFLEYVFRRCQRENYSRSEEDIPHVGLNFLNYPGNFPFVTYLPCGICEKPSGVAADICHNYAAHGWCKSSTQCQNSHDIDLILEHEAILVSSKKRRRKRKHKNKEMESDYLEVKDTLRDNAMEKEMSCEPDIKNGTSMDSHDIPNPEGQLDCVSAQSSTNLRDVPNVSRTGGHRAGFDAFMTGLIFASFIPQHGHYSSVPPNAKLSDLGMQNYVNKITLSGKDNPLQVAKSNFVKVSKDHRKKMDKIIGWNV